MSIYEEQPHYATLANALTDRTVDDLKKLAPLVSDDRSPTRKAEIVNFILQHFESNVHAFWKGLDTLQKAAISEALHAANGQFDAERFAAKYGKSPNWGVVSSWGTLEKPSLLALFFVGSAIPDDLKQKLNEFVPPPVPTRLKVTDLLPEVQALSEQVYDEVKKKYVEETVEIPIIVSLREQPAERDLQAVLRLVNAGKLSVSEKTRWPSATAVKAVDAILMTGDYYDETTEEKDEYDQEIDPIQAFAWPMILQAAKLAVLTGKKLALTKSGQNALSAPPADTLRLTWKAWVNTDMLDEMRRINAIKGQTGNGMKGMTKPGPRRVKIEAALKECPIGKWIFIDDFLRYLIAADHNFEVTHNIWSLYISENYYGNLGQGGNTWAILEGRYALCLLFEYAATLGLVDVAYIAPGGARNNYSHFWGVDDLDFFSRYDGLLYFRLNALGAYCLELTNEYTPAAIEVKPLLRILPNQEIVVTEPRLPGGEALLLSLFAEKTSDLVWRLDLPKILSAIEEGHSLEELRELLVSRSGAALPDTVDRLITEQEERRARFQMQGTARLILCTDTHLRTLIIHDPRTRRYCYPAGDNLIAVPIDSETAFRKALRQLGYRFPGSGCIAVMRPVFQSKSRGKQIYFRSRTNRSRARAAPSSANVPVT